MKTDGLKEKYKDLLIKILATNPRVEQVILFGSRSNNTFTRTSDIDLVLLGDELTLTDQARLIEEIHKTTVPFQVDLLRCNSISNQELLDRIIRDGVVWFTRTVSSQATG